MNYENFIYSLVLDIILAPVILRKRDRGVIENGGKFPFGKVRKVIPVTDMAIKCRPLSKITDLRVSGSFLPLLSEEIQRNYNTPFRRLFLTSFSFACLHVNNSNVAIINSQIIF